MSDSTKFRKRQLILGGVLLVVVLVFGYEWYRTKAAEKHEAEQRAACAVAERAADDAWNRYLFLLTMHSFERWNAGDAPDMEPDELERAAPPNRIRKADLEVLRALIARAPREVEAPNVDELASALSSCSEQP